MTSKIELAQLREVLPIQNPLHSFVHNNLLIAWEKYPFWLGSHGAATVYGARFPRELEFYQGEYKKSVLKKRS